jgi:hypothetical protein
LKGGGVGIYRFYKRLSLSGLSIRLKGQMVKWLRIEVNKKLIN